ncbi:PEPxxWA-CTERM sorting domain-containing protein [Sphingosinicellaceae bacterium]|nr:PEPxxWA-CTERM sorting domain-containing protein [Sphingosinicellaceae bacterium]
MQGYFQADYTGTQTSRAVDTENGVFSGGGALVTGFSFAVVPEPQAWALMIVGFGLVGAAARRRTAVVA